MFAVENSAPHILFTYCMDPKRQNLPDGVDTQIDFTIIYRYKTFLFLLQVFNWRVLAFSENRLLCMSSFSI